MTRKLILNPWYKSVGVPIPPLPPLPLGITFFQTILPAIASLRCALQMKVNIMGYVAARKWKIEEIKNIFC